MLKKAAARLGRTREHVSHRWRLGAGLAILAIFVGIGVVPARRGLTVRYHGAPKSARKNRRSSSRKRAVRRR